MSLLQYMKNTDLDNPDISVKDERIVELDKIVGEVRQSEEWEAVKMNILEIGIEKGRKKGIEEGIEKGMEKGVEKGIEKGIRGTVSILKNLGVPLQTIQAQIQEQYGISPEALKKYL